MRNGKILKVGVNGHIGKFCKDYSKVIWAKLADFRAKLKVQKTTLIMALCVFVDSIEPFLICSVQISARKNN